MQRSIITTVTKEECDEYTLLYEKMLAYRSLKDVIKNNREVASLVNIVADDEERLKIIDVDEKKCIDAINAWWDKIDKKYILEFDDRRLLVLDFDDRTIYSVDRIQWNNANSLEAI